ncbi:DeoR/GlpR family DNA-binding transcription regulator [Williamsoniiplasma lucivorax]|uniref:DeoR family transcriptional regulator, lactose phosphotransferase system repressor n=1 Tax=Williamsoniiplasma lucivorax TaxID=209274 RepID=A0A2S5REJ4_9MOLU|nr:DeoR/GlpR family DNA-binding transcription regulator [Williamsoniiplasma lucivorax]PPE05734.1 DeoR family transcriptional regulator, lactose phosphotransferase system repressor [Williamsoniiplasma lucivorax]
MKRAERIKNYIDEIKSRGVVSQKEFFILANSYEIKNLTARRDLVFLLEKKIISNKYGKIMLWKRNNYLEETRDQKKYLNLDKKAKIAVATNAKIPINKTVFVSAGTTTEEFIKNLKKPIYELFTNSLEVFNLAVKSNYINHLFLIGGKYRGASAALVDKSWFANAGNLTFDLCVITGTNLWEDGHIYNNDKSEAEVIQMVVQRSKQVIVLMDSTKLKHAGYAKVMQLTKNNLLIVDNNLTPEQKSKLELVTELWCV